MGAAGAILPIAQGLGGLFSGGGSSGSGGGPSAGDFANAAFQNQQGKVAANALGASQGVGNSTGVVTALNANDLNTMTQLAGIAQQQQAQAQAASANLSGATGLLSGLFGNTGGLFSNTGATTGT